MDALLPLKTVRAIIVALIVLATGYAGYLVYDAVYDRGYAAGVAIMEKEMDAIRAANDRAVVNAEKGLREDVALLILEKEKLEDDVARLNREAAQDPDALSCGLGLGSVQRLNSIR